MTPNQITGTANALRNLLEQGHRQHLTPAFDPARVCSLFTSDAYHVRTHWIEPEGGFVTMSALVHPDGTIEPQPAHWSDATQPDPVDSDDREGWATDAERDAGTFARPGVRVVGDEPYYSADWLE